MKHHELHCKNNPTRIRIDVIGCVKIRQQLGQDMRFREICMFKKRMSIKAVTEAKTKQKNIITVIITLEFSSAMSLAKNIRCHITTPQVVNKINKISIIIYFSSTENVLHVLI